MKPEIELKREKRLILFTIVKRKLRQGYKPIELARILDINPSIISRIVRGKQNYPISIDLANKYINILKKL